MARFFNVGDHRGHARTEKERRSIGGRDAKREKERGGNGVNVGVDGAHFVHARGHGVIDGEVGGGDALRLDEVAQMGVARVLAKEGMPKAGNAPPRRKLRIEVGACMGG